MIYKNKHYTVKTIFLPDNFVDDCTECVFHINRTCAYHNCTLSTNEEEQEADIYIISTKELLNNL